jgi:hypothetical protein
VQLPGKGLLFQARLVDILIGVLRIIPPADIGNREGVTLILYRLQIVRRFKN